jgi:predicted Rossmann-fold nucleotide-binding protein
LFDQTYWRRIIDFEAMAEEGTIAPEDVRLITYVESAEEAWRRICDHYGFDPSCARPQEEHA